MQAAGISLQHDPNTGKVEVASTSQQQQDLQRQQWPRLLATSSEFDCAFDLGYYTAWLNKLMASSEWQT